jgi:hypothetical protein
VRLFRTPLVHFVAGGALLFCLTRVVGEANDATSPAAGAAPVVVSAAEVAQLRHAYTQETGLAATVADEAALVEDAIDEELLFREALARGLDRNDRSVRSWLVEQMRVLTGDTGEPDGSGPSDDALYARALELGLDRNDLVVRRILVHKIRLLASRVDADEASDAELRAFHARHAEEYRLTERLSLWHVFVARDRHGASAEDDATRLLVRFREQRTPPAEAAREGDSFPMPARLVAQSRAQLEKLFGAAFAAAVLAAPERAWSGPVASPYGVHLVWVERREPGAPAPFEEVRGRVREAWREERSEERLAALLRALRAQRQLVVESRAWSARRSG